MAGTKRSQQPRVALRMRRYVSACGGGTVMGPCRDSGLILHGIRVEPSHNNRGTPASRPQPPVKAKPLQTHLHIPLWSLEDFGVRRQVAEHRLAAGGEQAGEGEVDEGDGDPRCGRPNLGAPALMFNERGEKVGAEGLRDNLHQHAPQAQRPGPRQPPPPTALEPALHFF